MVGTYAATRPYVCPQCGGKGCSNCKKQGIKVRNLHLIGDQLNGQHVAAQKHLKDIKGVILEEEKDEETKILESYSS